MYTVITKLFDFIETYQKQQLKTESFPGLF